MAGISHSADVKNILLALVTVAMAACSTVPTVNTLVPVGRHACLYDEAGHWREGDVVQQREDDRAKLFKFKDPSEGDHGFIWLDGEDMRLRPCAALDAFQGREKGGNPFLARIRGPVEQP